MFEHANIQLIAYATKHYYVFLTHIVVNLQFRLIYKGFNVKWLRVS
jgi:hypothetical protein